MGVAMKNNNEAAAFHVADYDMVVNEECWIYGSCQNYVSTRLQQSRALQKAASFVFHFNYVYLHIHIYMHYLEVAHSLAKGWDHHF